MKFTKRILSGLVFTGMILCLLVLPVQGAQTSTAPIVGVSAPKKPALKGKVSGTKLTLSWNKVSGAKGYYLYLYNKSQNTFRYYKNISGTKTSFTFTGKNNSTWKFRLKAYKVSNGTKVFSAASSTVTLKTPPSPAVTITTAGHSTSTKILLRWSKYPYAEGYQIYRAVGAKGAFKQIKTLSGNTTLSYTDSGLKTGVTYYYKIRCYRKYTGGTVYSAYSSTKAISPSNTSGKTVLKRPILLVGDSRTVFLKHYFENDDAGITWICKSGAGLSWLTSTAEKEIAARLNGKTDLYIWLGANDAGYMDRYVAYYNKMIPEWKKQGANVYIIAVGPIESDPYVSDATVKKMNVMLKNDVQGATFMSLYYYMQNNGFKTIDGIHYDYATCKLVYDYIMKQAKKAKA